MSDAAAAFRRVWAPRGALAEHVASIRAERSPAADPLLPDGAVELVWSGRGLFVRGSDTRPHPVGLFPDRTFVVLSFRPGAAAGLLGLHGPDLLDARVGISALWGRAEMERLEAALVASRSPKAAADVLEIAVAKRIRSRPDPQIAAVVATLRRRREPARVARLADAVGLSERQLLRRFTAALGYGPKTLDRILRFQRFRELAARRPDLGLAELAALAGYADQAHLTRECLRLGGETPAAHVARLT